jgi:hypothetical protein
MSREVSKMAESSVARGIVSGVKKGIRETARETVRDPIGALTGANQLERAVTGVRQTLAHREAARKQKRTPNGRR